MVTHIEILAEELSMEAALRSIVPKIIGDLSFEVYPFLRKDDLLNKLPARLRGYAAWLPPDWQIVVIVDRDDDGCNELKHRLEETAQKAGFSTRSLGNGSKVRVVNRLAIEELEAWFFGDWDAVLAAYPKTNPNIPKKMDIAILMQ